VSEQKSFIKVGGLDLSRRDLDRDLDLDAKKVSVSTVEKSRFCLDEVSQARTF
jgi:hypothetical protein